MKNQASTFVILESSTLLQLNEVDFWRSHSGVYPPSRKIRWISKEDDVSVWSPTNTRATLTRP